MLEFHDRSCELIEWFPPSRVALLARGKNEEAKRVPEAFAQTLNAPGMGAPPPYPTLYSVARAAKMLSLENWITVEDMVDATVDGLVM